MGTRDSSKLLKVVGFACLIIGAFGRGHILPTALEITLFGVSVLSFGIVALLYLWGDITMTRVPRSTFWTMMGSLFAVALLVGRIIISVPSDWSHRYPAAMALLIFGPMLVVVVAAVIIQVRRWHDLNASGWWILINAIPYLGQLATIIVCGFIPGTRGPNRFGPDPLGRTAPAPTPPPVRPAQDPTRSVARGLDCYDEQQHLHQSSPPPASAQPAPRATAAPPLENELRSLAALKADGIISEEEFTAKKRTLLGL